MKKVVYIVLLVLVLGGAGFWIYSKNKDKNNTASSDREYGILNPNPNEQIPVSRDNTATPPKETPVAQKPSAAVPPKKTTKTPTVSGASTGVVTTSTASTYTISGLKLGITVPNTLKPRLEEASGNVVAFYEESGRQVGHIEVFVDSRQSFDSLLSELQANPNVNSIQQTTVNGIPALSYNDARYGSTKVIALVYANNTYYLRGSFANSTYFPNIQFLK